MNIPASVYLRDLYLDRVNNYLTTEVFAEHNGISKATALTLLELGKNIHEYNVEHYKETKGITQ